MNLKHEMFWNCGPGGQGGGSYEWTLNMKCFEIEMKPVVDEINKHEP